MNLRPLRKTSRPPGFTLVESMVAVVIVSGVLVASLGTFGAISKARLISVERAAAVHVGEQVLAEILQCHYADPASGSTSLGLDAGESARSTFDDVDDYDGWTMSSLTERNGTAMTGYAGWSVQTSVNYAQLNKPDTARSGDKGLKRIKVTVSTARGATVVIQGLRAKNGVYEQTPATTTTYLTFTGISAKVGERGKTIYGGAHPLNVTTSQ